MQSAPWAHSDSWSLAARSTVVAAAQDIADERTTDEQTVGAVAATVLVAEPVAPVACGAALPPELGHASDTEAAGSAADTWTSGWLETGDVLARAFRSTPSASCEDADRQAHRSVSTLCLSAWQEQGSGPALVLVPAQEVEEHWVEESSKLAQNVVL